MWYKLYVPIEKFFSEDIVEKGSFYLINLSLLLEYCNVWEFLYGRSNFLENCLCV